MLGLSEVDQSVRMSCGKTAEYKPFWIKNEKNSGGERTFCSNNWIDKINKSYYKISH